MATPTAKMSALRILFVHMTMSTSSSGNEESLQAAGIKPHEDKEDVWAYYSSHATQPEQSPRKSVRFEGALASYRGLLAEYNLDH